MVEIIHRHTVSDKYKDEEVGSNRVYPSTYHVRPVEAQVTELKKCFPSLGNCQEKLARRKLPFGAEAWFAIPRWQALAPTYNEAVEMVVGVLTTERKLQNRIIGRLGSSFLRQSERSKLAESIIAEQQQGNDLLVVAAQAGNASSWLLCAPHPRGPFRQRVWAGRLCIRVHVADPSGAPFDR